MFLFKILHEFNQDLYEKKDPQLSVQRFAELFKQV
jgi:hypothetical protein